MRPRDRAAVAAAIAPRGRGRPPAPGRPEVTMVEVVLAIPDGSARPRSRRELMTVAAAWPGLSAQRADRQAGLLAWIRVHARWASWFDGSPVGPRATARPTRAQVCAEAGFSPASYKRYRAIWEAWGFVGTVREGRTEHARGQTRRRDVDPYDGNDAKIIVLCVPAVPSAASASSVTEPPKDGKSPGETPHAPARDAVEKPGRSTAGGTALRAGSLPARPPLRPAVPRQLASHGVLRRLSEAAIRSAWRPFARRGWTPSDWLHAIDYRPDGRQHRKDLSWIRRPAGWLRWRLRFWIHAGTPILSRSQRAAVRRLEERQQRELEAVPHSPGAGPGAEYRAARQADHRLRTRQKGK